MFEIVPEKAQEEQTARAQFLSFPSLPSLISAPSTLANPTSRMEGEPCRVGSNRFPDDSRLVEWKLAGEEKLLCEARKSEYARRVSECSDWA